MHVVVVGGGAIGVSTAYFLSLRAAERGSDGDGAAEASEAGVTGPHATAESKVSANEAAQATAGAAEEVSGSGGGGEALEGTRKECDVRITVLESDPDSVAPAASGKAGGFLARDWCVDALEPFARESFDLHARLAQELGGAEKYGYRRVNAYSVSTSASSSPAAARVAAAPPTATEEQEDDAKGDSSTTAEGGVHMAEKPPQQQQQDKKRQRTTRAGAAAHAHTYRPSSIPWLVSGGGADGSGRIGAISSIGTPDTAAQVHPGLYTQTLMSVAVERGVALRLGFHVASVTKDARSQYTITSCSGDTVQADVVVIAMGPWSKSARDWFPGVLPDISHTKACSVVLRPRTAAATAASIGADAIFLSHSDGARTREPEIYPRPDGTVYMCGHATDAALPERAAQVEVEAHDVETLEGIARTVAASSLGSEKTAPLLTRQACHLPAVDRYLPLIGEIPGTQRSAFIATGHTCWGILTAPATGLAVSELILDGRVSSVPLSPAFAVPS